MNDESLFNIYFNNNIINDSVGKFALATYNQWIEYKNNNDFYSGFIEPKTFDSLYSAFTRRKCYNKYISRNDVTFLKSYNKLPFEKFDNIDKVFRTASDIARNEIFSPPVFFYHNNEIHPGKFLAKACSLLDKELPVLVVKDKKTSLRANHPVILERKLENLSDIVSLYKGKIYMFFMKYSQKDFLQVFSLHNNWNKLDCNGWIGYPEYDFKRFWISFENMANAGKNVISFYHPSVNRSVQIKYSKKNSHVLKEFLLRDGYKFFKN